MLLVAGASGFVGSHVARRAAAEGLRVRRLIRGSSNAGGADVAIGDLLDGDSLARAFIGIETVIDAAAITANGKPAAGETYDRVNRIGTENLVAAAKAAGVRRIVLVSGLGTRPAPPGTYMATRWAMEEAVRTSGLEYVILQPSVLFGGGAAFITGLAEIVRRSPVVPLLGSAGLRFQPLWIEDLVTCLLQSARTDFASGATLSVGGGEIVTLREVVAAIAAALHKRRLMVQMPLWSARLPAAAMAALLPHPPLTPSSLELFAFDNVADLDSVERSFHFTPRGLREHIAAHGIDG